MDFSQEFSRLIASGSFTEINLIMKDAINQTSKYLEQYCPNKTYSDNIVQAFYSQYGYIEWEPEQKQEIFRQLAIKHWNGSA